MTTEAEAALAATSTADLLTAAYALTHQIHAAERNGRFPDLITDARAQRDLITAEVLRRAGGQ